LGKVVIGWVNYWKSPRCTAQVESLQDGHKMETTKFREIVLYQIRIYVATLSL